MSSVICYGSPPVPVVTGARPAALGTQMQYHIECIRPMLKRTEQACSRYERGESAIIIGRA